MDIFDIIGPVMIGPSSSHTAGAVRIGNVGRTLMNGDIKKAKITLHGSFAKTAVGHGTDKAIVGGLLGYEIDDIKIKDSFALAKEEGMEFSFKVSDLGNVHPNTAVIEMKNSKEKKHTISACSVGGGKIEITAIDGLNVSFNGELNTTITFQEDRHGIIAAASGKLAERKINIANMKVFRIAKNKNAIMIIETDDVIPKEVLREIRDLDNINDLIFMPKL